MVDAQIESKLIEALYHLSLPEQRMVLDVALRLSQNAESTSGSSFESVQSLVGPLPSDVADEMEKAIEEHCEQIDANEW